MAIEERIVELLTRLLEKNVASHARSPARSVTVLTTSTPLMRINPERVFATIVNDSLNDVYISFGAVAVMGAGILLRAQGGSMVFGSGTDLPYLGEVSAIAAAPSSVTIIEA